MSLHIPRRYELKYVLPLSRVAAVREAIRPYCELDFNSEAVPGHTYFIRSIYLDTDDFALHRASRAGVHDRFKVRVRQYGPPGSASPVFLEVKRKANGMVRKSRAKVPVAGWTDRLQALAADATPAERSFWAALKGHSLAPRVCLRYEREAWFSTVDEYARVTFDNRMVCQPARGWDFDGDESAWVPLDHAGTMKGEPQGVLLELKCTTDVPLWMARLAERLELARCGFSKYCSGVDRLFGHTGPGPYLTRTARWG